MKKFIILPFIVLLTGCMSSISGIVKDKETSTPIPSAVVTVARTNNNATTNAFGKYQIWGFFIRGDTLMINAPGYNIYTGTVVNGYNDIMDIELVPKK